MTLKHKIIASSTFVAILAAVAGMMTYQRSQSVEYSYTEKVEEWHQESLILDEIQTALTHSHIEMLKGINFTGKGLGDRKGKIEGLQNQITRFGALGEGQEEVANELMHSFSKLVGLEKSLGLASPESSRNKAEVLAGIEQVRLEMTETLIAAKAAGIVACQTEGRLIEGVYQQILSWISWASFSIFLCAIVFGQIIARDLSKAIDYLKLSAQRLSEGDYSQQEGLTRSDEFGKLSVSFNELAEDLQKSEIITNQNKQLADLNKRLKNKNDSLDSFVYRVSHDLKAPVINIQSLLKVINSQVYKMDNPVLTRATFFLGKTTAKLKQTIYDLLEVSRIEEHLKSSKEQNSIKTMVDQIVEDKAMLIKEAGVTISQDFEGASQIYFSKTNLKSILNNTIDNAIKYHSPDRPSTVALKTEVIDDYVCFSISDNGLGIDLKRQEKKMFGMFNRFHNHVEGSGVGLYIVKKLMDENEGKVEILSEVDKGTTIKLYFLIEGKGDETAMKKEQTELV